MGFADGWISKIMKFVETVKYIIKVNGRYLNLSPIKRLAARRSNFTMPVSSMSRMDVTKIRSSTENESDCGSKISKEFAKYQSFIFLRMTVSFLSILN